MPPVHVCTCKCTYQTSITGFPGMIPVHTYVQSHVKGRLAPLVSHFHHDIDTSDVHIHVVSSKNICIMCTSYTHLFKCHNSITRNCARVKHCLHTTRYSHLNSSVNISIKSIPLSTRIDLHVGLVFQKIAKNVFTGRGS